MTVMTGEHIPRDPSGIAVPQSDRNWLYNTEFAPAGWRFWLGHYKRQRCPGQWFRVTSPISAAEDVSSVSDEDSRLPNMQTTAFVIGQLFVFVMSSVHSDVVKLWSWQNAPRARTRLCEMQTDINTDIAWPVSNNPMTDNDACRFANAWFKYSEDLGSAIGYR
jgi:hypothetical protein